MKSKICVVGSSNIDQISYVENIPGDGETVFGSSYQMGFGGKGANQAVMASLLGAETYMITCLGEDVYADMTIENYKKNNINIDYLQIVPGSSGVAPIWVDDSGQNRIIVISGSNDHIDADKAIESLSKIQDLKILVGQFEIPLEVTEKVFSFARENNITTILNPAPAKIPSENLLSLTDWFIPNEVEFSTISNMDAFVDENLIKYANSISGNLIVTLGEKGAASIDKDSVIKTPAPEVKAVDTTGAGDAFVGAFAYGLSSELSPQDAIKLAVDRASDSVTKPGTQISYSKQ
ncbi:MAG: ribokinase [Actinomycetota bacterium]|nr:ribokinase [Actinomycetota bacterium]|tara:strand:+ start:2060 stop:2935 length:876 start_codon:yes stop_codon:yes gene_type:complete